MDPRIFRAIRMMECHLDSPLAIERVAGDLGLSMHHFHRLFAQATGEPPASFLRRIRLDAAALRLKWGNEPAADISVSVGYDSRPAFIRAFKRQFGVAPSLYRKNYRAAAARFDILQGRRVSLREIGSLHLLARRYVGDIFRMAEYWEDFLARLPKELALQAPALYVGLLHDDFRVTAPERVRYDCGIALDCPAAIRQIEHCESGLYLVQTVAGHYAAIDHKGHYLEVPESYDLLCHGCIIPRGFVPSHEPAIEIHASPRNMQNPDDLAFTILIPVE